MKIYVIHEVGYEYDDNYYHRGEDDGKLLSAYRDRNAAVLKAAEMTKAKKGNMEGQPPAELYTVVEVEVDETEVVVKAAGTPPPPPKKVKARKKPQAPSDMFFD